MHPAFCQSGTGDGIADYTLSFNGFSWGLDSQNPLQIASNPTETAQFEYDGGQRHIDVTLGYFVSESPPAPVYPGVSVSPWSLYWEEDIRSTDGFSEPFYFQFWPEPNNVGDFVSWGDWMDLSVSGWVRWKQYNYYYGEWTYVTDNYGFGGYFCNQSETLEVISKN